MKSIDWSWKSKNRYSEAAARRCSVKNVFLKISQNSQENSFVRAFLINLQAHLRWLPPSIIKIKFSSNRKELAEDH